MTLLELIHRLRQRLDDQGGDTGTVPAGYTYFWESDDAGTLWKNNELVCFINSAARELAHRLPIHDSGDNEVTRIALRSGQARYDIDPRILAIDSAVLASTGVPLVKLSEAKERSQWSDPLDTTYKEPSVVQQYRCDFDDHIMTVYATPTTSDTLYLSVRRLPLEPLTWANRKQDIEEFPEHLQEALLDWGCMQAYLKRDADTFNTDLSGYFQGQFTDRVGARVSFKHAQILKETAGTRLRTRTYY